MPGQNLSDGHTLPAFAQEKMSTDSLEVQTTQARAAPVIASPALDSAPRDPNAPAQA